jgi:hypothetical protein
MMRQISIINIILLLLISPYLYAVGASGVGVTHCTTNCGKVLVGAARIDRASIQWQGAESKGVHLYLAGSTAFDPLFGIGIFGFTGSFDSTGTPNANLMDYTSTLSNVWFFVSPSEVSISDPSSGGTAPKLGFYFSPAEAKKYESGVSYYPLCDGCQQNYPSENPSLKGEGVSDSKTTPALTLDVNGIASTSSDISVATGSTTQFTITPHLNPSLVPSDVQSVKYAEVVVKIDENNTSCKGDYGTVSFLEKQEEPNDFSENRYYHHLILESANQQRCSRLLSYLVSIDRPFTFDVTNQQKTGSGYVQYSFFINGHYNPSNSIETDYPGSHKTFRLRTDSTVVSNQKPTASFSIPTTATVNQLITLDASNSYDSDGSINSYEWSSSSSAQANFVSTINKTTSVSFSQAGNYTISLNVIDNKGDAGTLSKSITIIPDIIQNPQQATLTVAVNGTGGTVTSSDSVINCPSACSATYIKNATTTLTPIATTGYKFERWSADCAKDVATDGSITVTVDQNKTCLVTFVQKTTTDFVDKACFTMEYIDDRINFATDEIRKVKLDASCSGTYNQYRWRVYSTDTNTDNVSLPTTAVLALHDQFTGNVLPDGNYIVTLVVGEGDTQDQTSQLVTIPPLLAKFKTTLDSKKITVDATMSSQPKDSSSLSYQWWSEYLGKITPNTPGVTIVDSNALSQLTIDYAGKNTALTGNYYETLTLAITDSKGRISTVSQKAKVNIPAPVVIDDFSFVGNPTTNTDGTITVTLLGRATDPDGGSVNYTFTDSYGRSATKVEPLVDANSKEWQQATFNYASQETIADAYLLQVIDNEIGNDQTTASKILRFDLPKLTSATINNKGNFGNTDTIFHGGVSVDGGKTYQNPVTVKLDQPLAIRGYFEVVSSDINQLADILLIVGTEARPPFDGGVDTNYVSFGATGINSIDLYQSPDVWMAQLTNPFVKAVTLAKEMPLSQNLNLRSFTGTPRFFQWQSNTQWYFFLGYRLLDSKNEGKIVYSSQPITLKIDP